MTMTLLEDWCRGMDVDIHRALLVTGIPQDCGPEEMEETLSRALSPLGPYRVLNRIFVREENAKAALLEVGEGVSLRAVPREFPGRGGAWRVVCRNPTQDAEFLKNLNEFLDAEGRTWEDVVRLLHLNDAPAPRNRNRNPPPGNWVEALGALLGTVMQVIVHLDSELRSQEEARAQEAEEAYALAMAALAAGRKGQKEPGRAARACSVRTRGNPGSWDDVEDEGDPPEPLVRKARAKPRSRRRKQKKSPRQEPVPWKRPKGHHARSPASSEGPEAEDGDNGEVPECPRGSRTPRVKQAAAGKKPAEKCPWRAPRHAPQDAGAEAASEPEQDDGPVEPPKKKAMGWASAKSPGRLRRRRRKVSLGPVSYVLVGVEGTKKKPSIPKKGPGLRRGTAGQRALRGSQRAESPASAPQGTQAKPEGAPGECDRGSHLGCVYQQVRGEEQEWQVGADEPKEDPSAVETVGDTPVEGLEGKSPDLPPRSL
ncbi:paraneoplastic antigen-like protein 8A [Myotis daubentonii]|uniref:paraneoplastic antigen-like protein 8A n=1 Tax=Myotis daubentonii TaxID=98922 RepID=UPI0028737EBD|nr:paraneoplastic antigen-like protein 8A [Myotis daubentonii]